MTLARPPVSVAIFSNSPIAERISGVRFGTKISALIWTWARRAAAMHSSAVRPFFLLSPSETTTRVRRAGISSPWPASWSTPCETAWKSAVAVDCDSSPSTARATRSASSVKSTCGCQSSRIAPIAATSFFGRKAVRMRAASDFFTASHGAPIDPLASTASSVAEPSSLPPNGAISACAATGLSSTSNRMSEAWICVAGLPSPAKKATTSRTEPSGRGSTARMIARRASEADAGTAATSAAAARKAQARKRRIVKPPARAGSTPPERRCRRP